MTTAAPAAATPPTPAGSPVQTLDFVDPGSPPTTENILLYGPPGSGKSTGAASAPGPILWINAEGPDALRFPREKFPDKEIREVAFTGAAILDSAFVYARNPENGIKTVVLDSIREVYRVLLEEKTGVGGDPTFNDYGYVNTKMERFFRTLRDLPVNMVLLAHEDIADVDGLPTRIPLTGGKQLPAVVTGPMVGFVGYTAVLPPANEGEEPRYVAQLVEANGRRAKNRGGRLGPVRDVDLTEWIGLTTGQKGGE